LVKILLKKPCGLQRGLDRSKIQVHDLSMTDTRRKTTRTDPAGREPDPTEENRKVLEELDELGRRLAKALGIPVAAVNGSLTPEQRRAEDMAELDRELAEDMAELDSELAEDMAELDRELAEDLGIPVRKKPRARRTEPAAPAKPEPTPEQQRAREAALISFKYQPRKSTTLH
jgi:hypothetical protein